jgi:hypothetical protein
MANDGIVELSGKAGLGQRLKLTLAIPGGPVVAEGLITSWCLGLQQDERVINVHGTDYIERGLISCPISLTFEPTGLVDGLGLHVARLQAKRRIEKVEARDDG